MPSTTYFIQLFKLTSVLQMETEAQKTNLFIQDFTAKQRTVRIWQNCLTPNFKIFALFQNTNIKRITLGSC